MRGNFHAPFWSSGRQSDLPTDCTGTRPRGSCIGAVRLKNRNFSESVFKSSLTPFSRSAIGFSPLH